AVATLEPIEMFAGDAVDEIAITNSFQGTPSLIGLVDFEVGKTYLVAASDGNVGVCGFSGEATPRLQALYDATFE
ncbi:hypothetical protein, partial [Nocardioides sp.]|uniref:hypothetical protein n=1 Tax=Nocardioides sp. TaxID=35761 RepID=UPI00356A7BE6